MGYFHSDPEPLALIERVGVKARAKRWEQEVSLFERAETFAAGSDRPMWLHVCMEPEGRVYHLRFTEVWPVDGVGFADFSRDPRESGAE